jgi:23S rRNA G2069 N7-methylase RlmK/C1962 C5-methylase RlmI
LDKIIKKGGETLVYVGSKWGEEKRQGFRPLWVDVKNKNKKELVNLAIVRIKEEQDFLNNTLIKFFEVLNDLKLIEENFYNMVKYGTTSKKRITLIKNGIGGELSKLLVDKYGDFLSINEESDIIEINPKILEKMKDQKENEINISETKYNLRE